MPELAAFTPKIDDYTDSKLLYIFFEKVLTYDIIRVNLLDEDINDIIKKGDSVKGFEELTLELTDWCPSKCLHCSSGSGPNCRNELPYELALRLVNEAGQLGAAKVSLGGGEPTASENFLPVVHQTIERRMLVEVFTCGLSITPNGVDSLPTAIIEGCAGLKDVKFIFSFHGATAQTHDYITQTPRSYECLITSLKKCLKAGIECEMNFVPLKVNVDEFEHLIEIAENLKIAKISILRFVPQGRGALNRTDLELNPEEEDSLVNELLHLRKFKNIAIRTGSPFNGIIHGNQVPCRAGFGKLVIQADGNVLPCEVFKHQNRRHWDLSIHNMTLTQIIQSQQILDLYKKLRKVNCLECLVHKRLRDSQKIEKFDVISGVPTHTK
jgi:radical SAM protein with 4Fe4S-binding SPASM domain